MLSDIFDNPIIFALFRLLVHNSFKGRKKILKKLNMTGNEKVIDICCGTGYFSQLLPENYVGVDSNGHYIEYAKKEYGKNFILQDATNLKQFKDKSFDISFVIDCLHHFSDEDAAKLLKEACRIGKRVIIIDLIAQSGFNIIGKILEKLDRGEYVRTREHEVSLASKFVRIENEEVFGSGVYKEIAIIGKDA